MKYQYLYFLSRLVKHVYACPNFSTNVRGDFQVPNVFKKHGEESLECTIEAIQTRQNKMKLSFFVLVILFAIKIGCFFKQQYFEKELVDHFGL